jgi:predicted MPP superfamily phosphohydrolase
MILFCNSKAQATFKNIFQKGLNFWLRITILKLRRKKKKATTDNKKIKNITYLHICRQSTLSQLCSRCSSYPTTHSLL